MVKEYTFSVGRLARFDFVIGCPVRFPVGGFGAESSYWPWPKRTFANRPYVNAAGTFLRELKGRPIIAQLEQRMKQLSPGR